MKSSKNDTDVTMPKETRCKLCMEPILVGATVCRHCQRHQSNFVRHFPNIGVIVSVGLLLIAGVQLFQAFQERKKIIEAATLAKKASEVARSAQQSAALVIKELKVLKNETKQELASASDLAKRALSDINSAKHDIKKAANISAQAADIARNAKEMSEAGIRRLQSLETKIKKDLELASILINTAISDAKSAKQNTETTQENIKLAKIEEITKRLKELRIQSKELLEGFTKITRQRSRRGLTSSEGFELSASRRKNNRQRSRNKIEIKKLEKELITHKRQINTEDTH